jgi:hypothetical protein
LKDAERGRQELSTNAVKYGTGHVWVRLSWTAQQPDIDVWDLGPGFTSPSEPDRSGHAASSSWSGYAAAGADATVELPDTYGEGGRGFFLVSHLTLTVRGRSPSRRWGTCPRRTAGLLRQQCPDVLPRRGVPGRRQRRQDRRSGGLPVLRRRTHPELPKHRNRSGPPCTSTSSPGTPTECPCARPDHTSWSGRSRPPHHAPPATHRPRTRPNLDPGRKTNPDLEPRSVTRPREGDQDGYLAGPAPARRARRGRAEPGQATG